MDELTRAALDARAGDPAAAATFIRATSAPIWRLCAHLVDEQAADDLTQETYLRAFRALPAFRGDASARTWLLGIARRTCMDDLRTRVRRRRREAVLRGRPAGVVPDIGEQVAVAAALQGLDPDRRAAFALTQILGLSYREAAEVCDCPVGTIRSRVARARDDLIAAMFGDEASVAGRGGIPG